MMSLEDRRSELDALPESVLLRELTKKNPFGGYSIGSRRGQMTREQVTDTILRYEGYKLVSA